MTTASTVKRVIEHVREALQLEQIGEGDLDRPVANADISSPGLALAGFVKRFPGGRLQVLGETEVRYLTSLDAQRSYYSAQRSQVAALLSEVTNAVELYRTLGADRTLDSIPVG